MKFSASFVLAALPFLAAVSALPAHPKPESGEEAPAGAHVEKPAEGDDGPFVIPEQFKGVHIDNSVLDELKSHPNEMYYLYEDGTGKDVEQESKFLDYLIKNAVEDVVHKVHKVIKKHEGEGASEAGEKHAGKHLESREPEEGSDAPTPDAAAPRRRPGTRRNPRGSKRRERAALKRAQSNRERHNIRTRPRRPRQGQLQRGTGSRRQRQSKKTTVTSED